MDTKFKPLLRPAMQDGAFVIECKETEAGGYWPLSDENGILAWKTADARDHAMISIGQQLDQARK